MCVCVCVHVCVYVCVCACVRMCICVHMLTFVLMLERSHSHNTHAIHQSFNVSISIQLDGFLVDCKCYKWRWKSRPQKSSSVSLFSLSTIFTGVPVACRHSSMHAFHVACRHSSMPVFHVACRHRSQLSACSVCRRWELLCNAIARSTRANCDLQVNVFICMAQGGNGDKLWSWNDSFLEQRSSVYSNFPAAAVSFDCSAQAWSSGCTGHLLLPAIWRSFFLTTSSFWPWSVISWAISENQRTFWPVTFDLLWHPANAAIHRECSDSWQLLWHQKMFWWLTTATLQNVLTADNCRTTECSDSWQLLWYLATAVIHQRMFWQLTYYRMFWQLATATLQKVLLTADNCSDIQCLLHTTECSDSWQPPHYRMFGQPTTALTPSDRCNTPETVLTATNCCDTSPLYVPSPSHLPFPLAPHLNPPVSPLLSHCPSSTNKT